MQSAVRGDGAIRRNGDSIRQAKSRCGRIKLSRGSEEHSVMSKPLYKQSSAIGRDAGARSLERFVNNRSRGKAERLGEGIYNVIVIGAGTAGLVTAAGKADPGWPVACNERNK